MDLLHNLGIGFGVAFTLQNLLYAFFGAMLGTLIGVLPGIGPVATIAMLLPSTYALDATPALIMLAGIYYGAQYGGSTTAILINVPGESSSVVTAIDGYQMARQGRAGAALATAALGSFFAGCVGTVIIASIAIFGVMLEPLGLAITVPVLIVISSLAGDEFHWKGVVANAAVLTIGSWAIFIWGLKLTIPLWPAFVR